MVEIMLSSFSRRAEICRDIIKVRGTFVGFMNVVHPSNFGFSRQNCIAWVRFTWRYFLAKETKTEQHGHLKLRGKLRALWVEVKERNMNVTQ